MSFISDVLKKQMKRLPESSREPLQKRVYSGYAAAVRFFESTIMRKYAESLEQPRASRRRVVGHDLHARTGQQSPIPRKIWIYWDDAEVPAIVSGIINSIRRQSPGFELTLLNRDSVRRYIPDIHTWRSDLPHANRADLIRLHLLHDYGGIWLDATTWPGRNLDWVLEWAEADDLAFVAFENRAHNESATYPVVETWFLAAAKNHPFVAEWLRILSRLKYEPKQAVYDDLMQHESCRRLSEVIPDPFYRVVYLMCQQVFDNLHDPRLGLVAADDEAFYCFGQKARNSWDVAMNILVRPDFTEPPTVVKFTKRERMIIDAFAAQNAIMPRSMIGQLLANA